MFWDYETHGEGELSVQHKNSKANVVLKQQKPLWQPVIFLLFSFSYYASRNCKLP